MNSRPDITPDQLEELRKNHEPPMTQSDVAEILGLRKNHVSKIEIGLRAISSAEQKLLKLFFFGEIPFELIHRKEDAKHVLSFTPEEWKVIEVLARRSGVDAPVWIRDRIREYLAFLDSRETAAPKGIIPFESAEAWSTKHPVSMLADQASKFPNYFLGGVAAGEPAQAAVANQAIYLPRQLPDGHYLLRVNGASMEPNILDGSLIEVRALKDGEYAKQGSVVVYNDGLGATLKRLEYRKPKDGEEEKINNVGKVAVLKSDNPAFSEVQTLEDGRITAVFVGIVDESH